MGDDLFDDTETTPIENATVRVDGESITLDDTTTAAEVKDMASAEPFEQLTFRPEDADRPKFIPDDEPVLDYVDPKTTLTFNPAPGEVFG